MGSYKPCYGYVTKNYNVSDEEWLNFPLDEDPDLEVYCNVVSEQALPDLVCFAAYKVIGIWYPVYQQHKGTGLVRVCPTCNYVRLMAPDKLACLRCENKQVLIKPIY